MKLFNNYRRIHLDCYGHQTQCVRTAVQLFSRSVANSFQLEDSPHLSYFTSTVNDWFDTMDSRLPYHPYNQSKSGLGVNWELQKKNLEKIRIQRQTPKKRQL